MEKDRRFESWDNCSTIIVGKNASKTGRVILAHGEDDVNTVVQVHKVPRMEHKEGEVLTFDDGTAVVPQVPVTWGYLWSELRCPGGEPFADGFVNEWGVAVVSDSCVSTKESNQPYTGGLGYGMRRLIAERCKTAREGVEVAAQLMKEFGYRSTRSYHIADKDEGWVIQLTVGNNYVARRIDDDEIYYIPNWLTLHEVDFTDTEHKKYYWSEDLVGYAIRNGWYTPAVEGDYSDFDYAAAYQGEGSDVKSNWDRSDIAWSIITGGEPMPYRTTAIKAPRKFGVEDLKPILRAHGPEYPEMLAKDPAATPHVYYGICRDCTIESMIVEFQDDPDLTTIWRTTLRPCVSPYQPWFAGITSSPKGWYWLDVPSTQFSHLKPDMDDFKYHGDRAYWAFHMLNMTMEMNYSVGKELLEEEIKKMEAEWAATVPMVRETYTKLKEVNPEYAKSFLTDYVHSQAAKTWDWANQMTLAIVNKKDQESRAAWRSTL
ncbi:MAG: C69 family dipeptidase [Oscillospiraceae bacterium]|nr:C69 family dipeptidase [Oscillospiraceae bacterium]